MELLESIWDIFIEETALFGPFWVKTGGKISNFKESSNFSIKKIYVNDPKSLEMIHTDPYRNDTDVEKPFRRNLGHFRLQKLVFWAQIRG